MASGRYTADGNLSRASWLLSKSGIRVGRTRTYTDSRYWTRSIFADHKLPPNCLRKLFLLYLPVCSSEERPWTAWKTYWWSLTGISSSSCWRAPDREYQLPRTVAALFLGTAACLCYSRGGSFVSWHNWHNFVRFRNSRGTYLERKSFGAWSIKGVFYPDVLSFCRDDSSAARVIRELVYHHLYKSVDLGKQIIVLAKRKGKPLYLVKTSTYHTTEFVIILKQSYLFQSNRNKWRGSIGGQCYSCIAVVLLVNAI